MNAASGTETADGPTVIPRRVLFGDPDKINVALSPDGTLLGYAAPHQGAMNIWVQPVDGSTPARPVTGDRGRGITEFTLCAGGRIVYRQDSDGDESWRLYLLDLGSGQARLVTPGRGMQARVLAYHPWRPDQMLIELNATSPQLHDVYELDLPSGELTLIEPNPGHGGQPPFALWLADADLQVRGGTVPAPDGGVVVHIRDGGTGPYRPLIAVPGGDLAPQTAISFTRDGADLIMATSVDAPATRLARIDATTGQTTTISSDPGYDLAGTWHDPATLEPVVAAYAPGRTRYRLLDPSFAADLHQLTALDDGDVTLAGSAGDGRLLLAQTSAPNAPVRYYLYDRRTRTSRFLFPHRDQLAGYRLAPMDTFSLTARDGLQLHGYLTRPPGAAGPLPAVVVVHGGPWVRDHWCYHPEAQWLASRGYAVIQVNYRGSAGYGKAHLNAGNRQWGRAMHTDLLDAVTHLAGNGVIDGARVGIYGWSYGGYAALCGAAFSGEVFRCAVSGCGPADLATLVSSFPPFVQPIIAWYHARVGNPGTDAGQLRETSPLTFAASIRTPLLIAQGAQDPRVPRAQADALITTLAQHRVPHRYLLFDDEGHGLKRAANRETFYTETEKFLSTHLGGACEDTTGHPPTDPASP